MVCVLFIFFLCRFAVVFRCEDLESLCSGDGRLQLSFVSYWRVIYLKRFLYSFGMFLHLLAGFSSLEGLSSVLLFSLSCSDIVSHIWLALIVRLPWVFSYSMMIHWPLNVRMMPLGTEPALA